MRKIVLAICLMCSLCGMAQKHMTFMGISLYSNINIVQNKLKEKGFIPQTSVNSTLPIGYRAFKGTFSGYNCILYVQYCPKSKLVCQISVNIKDNNKGSFKQTYNYFYERLCKKYENISCTSKSENEGEPSYYFYLEKDINKGCVEENYYGCIDMFYSDNSGWFVTNIQYTDLDGLSLYDQEQNDDL